MMTAIYNDTVVSSLAILMYCSLINRIEIIQFKNNYIFIDELC
jgi:hypothetical protein